MDLAAGNRAREAREEAEAVDFSDSEEEVVKEEADFSVSKREDPRYYPIGWLRPRRHFVRSAHASDAQATRTATSFPCTAPPLPEALQHMWGGIQAPS